MDTNRLAGKQQGAFTASLAGSVGEAPRGPSVPLQDGFIVFVVVRLP